MSSSHPIRSFLLLLSVTTLGAGCGVEVSAPASEDVDLHAEAASAADLTFSGQLSASGTSWRTHAFQVTAGQRIEATLNWANASANLNLFLYSPDGVVVTYANGTTARPERVSYTADVSGTWSLGIKCKTGSSAYELTVDLGNHYPGRPAPGTLVWGAAVGGNGDPTARHEIPAGHPLAVRRTFWRWDQRLTRMITIARDDLANSRLPWLSVKTPPWSEMGAGLHDAAIDQMLTALDALPGPIWLTIHHEPEGGGGVNSPDDPAGPAGHVAMNRRVRERMTALGVDNVALAPILMSWTWNPNSGRNPEEWWAPGIYDFLGIDHYRNAEATLITPVWLQVRAWAAEKGVDIAVGEWGVRGTDAAAGARVREWYDHAAGSDTDGLGARVVGLSAFDSSLNSSTGSWELTGAQLTTFWDLLNDPRTADVVP